MKHLSLYEQPHQRRSALAFLWRLLLLACAFWVAGFVAFIASIPRSAPRQEVPADAIIVLTGGGDRLAEGFRLLEAGKAPRLFISGVGPGLSLAAILAELDLEASARPDAALLACCVSLGHQAVSTLGNARESVDWMLANEVRSAILVTANYHIQRSLLEFRRELRVRETAIALRPHAAFPSEVQDSYWFMKPTLLLLMIGEYHKLVAVLLRGWWEELRP